MTGYLDCLDEARLPAYPSMSNRALASAILSEYEQHPEEQQVGVGTLIERLGKLVKRKPKSNEEFGYSGDYWYQIRKEDRLGYVEGFISCSSEWRLRVFSKPAEAYVESISKWYGLTPDGEDMDATKVNEPLRKVLLLLAQAIR